MPVNAPAFRGKLPQVRSNLGGTTPEIAAANTKKALQDIQASQVEGGEHSDIGPKKNEELRGTGNDQTVEVSFKTAGRPVFVGHTFGYVVRNWHVVDIDGPAHIYRPTESKYRPTDKGIWLVSDQDSITARIRLDGQRGAR